MESVKKRKTSKRQMSFLGVAKRVIAPYVKIVRKGQVPTVKKPEESKQFSFYLQKKPSVLLRDLSAFVSDSVDLPSLLHETSEVLKTVTKASGVALYMVDQGANEIYQSQKHFPIAFPRVRWKIEEGTILSAFVAYTKKYIMIDDILQDDRFPGGIGFRDELVKSVLCMPIVKPDGECFAVVELARNFDLPHFGPDELKITLVVTRWMGATIYQNQQRLALQKQQELNDYLLDLTRCYFEDNVLTEKMITEIVKFAKVTLNAERSSFFLLDKDSDELVADLYDDGIEEAPDQTTVKKSFKIRMGKDKGIAGLVARTGQIVNVKDVYNDPRFNKEIDQKTGFITRSILCLPVIGVGDILGVVQVINKKNGGCFTPTDEILFQTFSCYSALALHYAKINSQFFKTDKLNKVYVTLLKRQMKPCNHDFENFVRHSQLDFMYPGLREFKWYITPNTHVEMPQMILYMFNSVWGEESINQENMIKFILCVKKMYRSNPYHNLDHAFSTLHCIFNIIEKNLIYFSPIDCQALMLGALCHDIDHTGFTNQFLIVSNDVLGQLYDVSPAENHHFKITCLLLEEYEIFADMTEQEYKIFMDKLKKAILATDLSYYFTIRLRLDEVVAKKAFSFINEEHLENFHALLMAMADFNEQCKPYMVTLRIVEKIYTENYAQGAEERSMGLSPLSFMDKLKQHMIPMDQLRYLMYIVIPATRIVSTIFPNTVELLEAATLVAQTWKEIIELKGLKSWRQDDSIVKEKKDI